MPSTHTQKYSVYSLRLMIVQENYAQAVLGNRDLTVITSFQLEHIFLSQGRIVVMELEDRASGHAAAAKSL